MDYEKKQKELKEKFANNKEELEYFKQEIAKRENELLRLQGEYRLLQEIHLEDNNK